MMSATQSAVRATGKALLACAAQNQTFALEPPPLAQQAKQTKVVVSSVEIVVAEDNDLNRSSGL
jgi:hypothetical protein